VTVLFADLVGSTAMSDRLEPAVLARVLNGYFQRMSDAIHEHRGHVAHFLGDGIVAYFGGSNQTVAAQRCRARRPRDAHSHPRI